MPPTDVGVSHLPGPIAVNFGAEEKAVEADQVLARLLVSPVWVDDHIHRIAVEGDLALTAIRTAGDVLDHGKPLLCPLLSSRTARLAAGHSGKKAVEKGRDDRKITRRPCSA